jgi:putative DNA primase/helicase
MSKRSTRGAPEPTDAPVLPDPADPMAVVRELIEDCTTDGCQTLRRWRGGWIRWRGTHWADVEDTEIRSWIYRRLEHAHYWFTPAPTKADPDPRPELRPWQPNRYKVANVIDALTSITHLAEDIDGPAWLDDPAAAPADRIVACRNGLLDVTSRELHALTPRFFNRVSVPFDYDPDATEPKKWLEFLDELWPDDPESIAALQEFFGYVLSGRTDLHKIMLLIGPTRSGKGTIARILTALVGRGNAAGPTLASLGTNFGLSPLLGKPLAVVSDARLGKENVHQVVERLLSISGEDMLTVDVKYREPWTGKLPARFLVLSNELPRFGDASGAIANRFVVLATAVSFLGREDPELTAKLHGELPGVLGWALDGLDRLATGNTFTEPASSGDAISALQDLVSPVSAFVRDQCEIGGEVEATQLYKAWQGWAETNGHRPGSVQTFGRDLRAVVPALKVVQPRVEGGRERRYVGVRLPTAHNEMDRVPSRASAEPDPPARTGTRSDPLWAPHPCDAADPSSTASNGPPCTECGEPLLLSKPGRTVCERCRKQHKAAS